MCDNVGNMRTTVEIDMQKVKMAEEMAKSSDNASYCKMGFLHEVGHGVMKDWVEAVKWYRKAAESGDDHGAYKLGISYEYGLGVEKNHTKAVEWYRKAAEQGHPSAQYRLAKCYVKGSGVERSLEEAEKWIRCAAMNKRDTVGEFQFRYESFKRLVLGGEDEWLWLHGYNSTY